MIPPNFLIVGAAKAGTTSIYTWLKQHPEIFLPDIKEPSFFVEGYGMSSWDQYLSLFQPAQHMQAVGEASTAYLATPDSAQRICERLGRVKIIILLRNPAERAFSMFAWMVMEGYEWLYPFERALAEEEPRFCDESFRKRNPEYFWDYMYYRCGLYYEQVKRYIETFGKEFVRVYFFEDLVSAPQEVYKDITAFLNVSPDFQPDFIPQNPSIIPRFIGVQNVLRRLRWSTTRLPKVFREQFVSRSMALNKKAGYRPSAPPELEKLLRERYRADVGRLGALVNRDLSAWCC